MTTVLFTHIRTAVAVGHTFLVIMYHLIKEETAYQDLGATYFDERDRAAVERRLIRRLEQLGYRVAVTATTA